MLSCLRPEIYATSLSELVSERGGRIDGGREILPVVTFSCLVLYAERGSPRVCVCYRRWHADGYDDGGGRGALWFSLFFNDLRQRIIIIDEK